MNKKILLEKFYQSFDFKISGKNIELDIIKGSCIQYRDHHNR